MFADAKGGVPLCVSKGQHKSKSVDQAQPKVEPKQDQRPVACSAKFDSQYRGDNSYRDEDRNFGRSDQHDNHYDNNYRTDHQVNFCKIESSDVGKGQAKFSSPHSSSEGLPRKDRKGSCHFPRSRLPTAIGTINGKKVRVLRDTGCTG